MIARIYMMCQQAALPAPAAPESFKQAACRAEDAALAANVQADDEHAGTAIGMAMEGLRPIVEMQFADFVTVAFDQLATVASKMHYLTQGKTAVPLVVRMPSCG